MKKRLDEIRQQLLTAIKRNPVEILLSLLFCALGLYQIGQDDNNSCILAMLTYSPVLYMLTYVFNTLRERGWSQIFYYASPLLVIPFIWIKLSDGVQTTLIVSIIVVQLIYFVSCQLKDNDSFMRKFIIYFTSLFSAALLAWFFVGLSAAIIASIQYIFDIEDSSNPRFLYAVVVAGFVILPLLFVMFNRERESNIGASKIFNLLLNYLLSPALLIYTAILYIYLIKIVILGSLPKGGIAYMVVAFSALLFLLKGCQRFLQQRHYDWFYNKASLIALPALAMYWIGSIYRINEYGFTESRVYLVVVGLILTGTALLFLSKKTGKYLYSFWLAIVLLSVVTYIPGINAMSIERCSQVGREVQEDQQETWIDIANINETPVDIEGFKSLLPVSNSSVTPIWMSKSCDSLKVFDRDSTLLFEESIDQIWINQLSKVGLTQQDSIPSSLYSELLKLDVGDGRLIFDHITLRRDSLTYKIDNIVGLYYLNRK